MACALYQSPDESAQASYQETNSNYHQRKRKKIEQTESNPRQPSNIEELAQRN
jgi:hypothetical protein